MNNYINLNWSQWTPEQDKHFFVNSTKCLGMRSDLMKNPYYVPFAPNDDIIISCQKTPKAFVNSCSHKQAKLIDGTCEGIKKLICPVHKWSFDEQGIFLTGRGFEKTKDKNLTTVDIFQWQDFIMSGNNDWTKEINEKLQKDLLYFQGKDFINWKRESMISNFNWKIFYETFLDLYHIRSYHPGLKTIVDTEHYAYVFGEGWSCQYAFLNKARIKSNSEKTNAWLNECESLNLLNDEKFKILWLGIYPNVMLESYPGTLIISQVYPHSPNKHINTLEFYFDRKIMEQSPNFPQLTYDCWMETAQEDDKIGVLMQQGRNYLGRYVDKVAQHDHPMEELCNTHWFDWMRSKEKLPTEIN